MRTLILIISAIYLTGFVYAQNLAELGIKTIVIDAGHGGKDPGCHGKNTHEKDVCLSIALKLGAYIEKKYPKIKVVYTRKKDVFIELKERAAIANRNKADLFICIHANAGPTSAFGAETYVLGLHRTEAQKQIAERENSTIFLEEDGGEKYKDFDMSPDALIARSIQLSVFLDQSISFASKVQSQFKTLGRFDRGVKQAGFLVLYQTTMPSVLIETGFLSRPDEEKFLKDSTNQAKMANSIFKAFQQYKNEIEGVNHLVEDADAIKKIEEDEKKVQEVVKKEELKTVPPDAVVFKVQIEASKSRIKTDDKVFKGYQVSEYEQDGLYKYTIGQFVNDYDAAKAQMKELKESDFPLAFVVAFQNGIRINLEKAIKLAEK
ncbi:MAG: N-acetylmuramoyl-L-alanine amidase [Crocinitomicaceae bacterium]